MNKNRARTQRRLSERNKPGNFRQPFDKMSKRNRSLMQSWTAKTFVTENPVKMDTPYEVQRTDASGRFRKAPGVPRSHTFGLARERAFKLIRTSNVKTRYYWPAILDEAVETPRVRVRNAQTGETFPV